MEMEAQIINQVSFFFYPGKNRNRKWKHCSQKLSWQSLNSIFVVISWVIFIDIYNTYCEKRLFKDTCNEIELCYSVCSFRPSSSSLWGLRVANTPYRREAVKSAVGHGILGRRGVWRGVGENQGGGEEAGQGCREADDSGRCLVGGGFPLQGLLWGSGGTLSTVILEEARIIDVWY